MDVDWAPLPKVVQCEIFWSPEEEGVPGVRVEVSNPLIGRALAEHNLTCPWQLLGMGWIFYIIVFALLVARRPCAGVSNARVWPDRNTHPMGGCRWLDLDSDAVVAAICRERGGGRRAQVPQDTVVLDPLWHERRRAPRATLL